MLKDSISKALSDQVNAEFYSAYLYLAMSSYSDRIGFKGFAQWLFVQYQEETSHATHMYQYILGRGANPEFPSIEAPPQDWVDTKDIFEKVLEHEQYVTSRINDIASLAMLEKDHATYQFIQWYVNEQVEEEDTASDILQKLRNIGDNAGLLYSLDAQLGARTFTDPFANANG